MRQNCLITFTANVKQLCWQLPQSYHNNGRHRSQVCKRYEYLMVEQQGKVFLSAQNNKLMVNYRYLHQFLC
jgi:hypothetical protein